MNKIENKIELALKCIDERFITHVNVTDEAVTIYIMEKYGKAIACICWFNDDDTYVCLSDLSVSPELRWHRLGTNLQEIREKIGIAIGAKKSYLWVEENTWQEQWYKRRGYKYSHPYEMKSNTIWMKKELI